MELLYFGKSGRSGLLKHLIYVLDPSSFYGLNSEKILPKTIKAVIE